jgi:hypothetical protein
MRSCSCPMSHLLVSEKGYTGRPITRSSDDDPTRDRGRHHRDTARHTPKAAASALPNNGTRLGPRTLGPLAGLCAPLVLGGMARGHRSKARWRVGPPCGRRFGLRAEVDFTEACNCA